MKLAAILAATLLALTVPMTGALAPTPPLPDAPLPPEFARLDPDGGRTLMLTLDDGEGGSWREFPVTDAGVAAFTNALQANNVAFGPTAYGGEVKEVGAFLHAWTLDGTPYVTLGAYFVTASQGKIRIPSLIVENVTDLGEMTKFVASLVTDDALPIAAETMPHLYALAAPDLLLAGILAGVVTILTGGVTYSVIEQLANDDNATATYNLPPEGYDALRDVAAAVAYFGYPIVYGQFGVGGGYGQYTNQTPNGHAMTYDWTDRPEVRVWTARKAAAGHDVWTGASVSRTGDATGDGVYEFHAWKRLAVGPATRIDGVVSTPAAAYVRADVDRHYEDEWGQGGASEIENRMVTTVGVSVDGEDVPLAQLHMDEQRYDDGDEGSTTYLADDEYEFGIGDGQATYLPDEQHSQWSAGTVVLGEYVPLVGARTDAWHRAHADQTNDGAPIFEWESERITSAGVFVDGVYTPLVGARTWVERAPPEFYALTLALDGVGSQIAGDMEASVGTFVLGAYTPVAGARYDDDFDLHLHAYRGMVSAGTYVAGAYQPLLGATYDGEETLTTWALAATGEGYGAARWQTSVGTFTLGFYRPILGTRYEPGTYSATGAHQESYQLGVYPLYYDPFLPVASVDYDGDQPSVLWATGVLLGGAGNARVDALAYTPGPYAFPLAGARYAPEAPDMDAPVEFHVVLGAYTPEGAFVPLAGASYASDAAPADVALSLAMQPVSNVRHEDARISVGPYVDGAYAPLATVNTALSPV